MTKNHSGCPKRAAWWPLVGLLLVVLVVAIIAYTQAGLPHFQETQAALVLFGMRSMGVG